MKGYKNSTRTKYECGGRVARKADGGMVTKQPAAAPAKSKPTAQPARAAKPVRPEPKSAPATPTRAVRKADGGAVGRGNRTQAMEAREGQKLMREVPARPTRGNNPRYTDEPAEARNARAAAAAERAERAAMVAERAAARTEAPRGPAGQGFRVQPMYEVNTGPSPSGQRVLRGLEGAARAVLPEGMERGAERYGLLPRSPRR